MVLDVSCAFLYADIKRRVYIELTTEDPESINGNMVGTLEKVLYGTRDAPQAWHDELSRTLTEIGLTTSARSPNLYLHEWLEEAMVAHVDDLLCSGPGMNLEWARAELSKKYEVKGRVVVEANSEIKFLGRIIARNEHRSHWEKDPKHQDILLEQWGLVCCNGVATPAAAAAAAAEQGEENKVEMQDLEATA